MVVDQDQIDQISSQAGGIADALQAVAVFSASQLTQVTIFGLGIMPYISASIIMQLLTAVIPQLERLHKEGEEGRRKITQYTRYGTVFIAAIQSFAISIWLEGLTARMGDMIVPVVPHPGFGFRLLTMLTLVSGTIFVMWLGEQITEKGIGNGISLIIFVGCLDQIPRDLANTTRLIQVGTLGPITMVFVVALMLAVTAAVLLAATAARRGARHGAGRARAGRAHLPTDSYLKPASSMEEG